MNYVLPWQNQWLIPICPCVRWSFRFCQSKVKDMFWASKEGFQGSPVHRLFLRHFWSWSMFFAFEKPATAQLFSYILIRIGQSSASPLKIGRSGESTCLSASWDAVRAMLELKFRGYKLAWLVCMSKGLSFSSWCCIPLVEASSPSGSLYNAKIQSSCAIAMFTPTHTKWYHTLHLSQCTHFWMPQTGVSCSTVFLLV